MPACPSPRPSPMRAQRRRQRTPERCRPHEVPRGGARSVAAHEIGARRSETSVAAKARAVPSPRSVLRSGHVGGPCDRDGVRARTPGGARCRRFAREHAAKHYLLTPGRHPGAARRPRGARGARPPPPLARLQGRLPRDARASVPGVPNRERGARLHRLRHGSLRVGVRQPRLAGREGARRLARRVRLALAEDGRRVRLRRRRVDLRLGRGTAGRGRLAGSRRERCPGGVPGALGDVDGRRLRCPLARRRVQRRGRDLGRRRDLEPGCGAARRPTPGGSTSS